MTISGTRTQETLEQAQIELLDIDIYIMEHKPKGKELRRLKERKKQILETYPELGQ